LTEDWGSPEAIVDELDGMELEIDPADLDVEDVLLVWTAWRVDRDGIAEQAYEL
jgi:hypothetical protein